MVTRVFPGLVEQINDFHTLSLQGLPVPVMNTFLTVHDDYFYHTANPRRPEVSEHTHSQTHAGTSLVSMVTVVVLLVQVGDVRIRFAYAGLSGDGFYPGPAHKVRMANQMPRFLNATSSYTAGEKCITVILTNDERVSQRWTEGNVVQY